ncbi:uncharacterized protein BJ212DRAFT_1375552 [Suillus subaureus]|uniref:Uncharacterized protein n=1 Tax=Suillus subaureus TaxID=48587 RepID=A0A9P7JAH9_9AGAM|nr:uncharacterized protein BJ212DRAFT_1375552 [Suillus subaureus]KAG1811203.1 hypothetical protein BJ212DRAFT_1375552 [Suillus subaureus]
MAGDGESGLTTEGTPSRASLKRYVCYRHGSKSCMSEGLWGGVECKLMRWFFLRLGFL